MNWDRQLSSILSAADDSVAKTRERLTLLGNSSKREEDFGTHAIPSLSPQQGLPSVSPSVQWSDIASILSQLQTQSQAIESLTKKLIDVERDKQSQQRHIQTLQVELCTLREDLSERRRETDGCPGAERSNRLSSTVCREDVEHLHNEVDQLKMRLRRQEEAMMLQEKEARETRRKYQHTCQMVQELTDRYRTHNKDLANITSECSHTQQEVRHISTTVSELEGEVRRLRERDSVLPACTSPLHRSRVKVEEEHRDSDSEDFSLTPSLADISSEDLSLLDDSPPHYKPAERQSRARTDFEDDVDDDVNPDLGSDLSLTDL
uniref:testis-specific gene 10 protein isoform X2 n=1 Tax=Doryrhamphus excisus TaxID=161450 RepID=UPI0025AE1DCB|nr:testis-specific gene 10 protein isoform X2 [Doryrhamphus excisus]